MSSTNMNTEPTGSTNSHIDGTYNGRTELTTSIAPDRSISLGSVNNNTVRQGQYNLPNTSQSSSSTEGGTGSTAMTPSELARAQRRRRRQEREDAVLARRLSLGRPERRIAAVEGNKSRRVLESRYRTFDRWLDENHVEEAGGLHAIKERDAIPTWVRLSKR